MTDTMMEYVCQINYEETEKEIISCFIILKFFPVFLFHLWSQGISIYIWL
jgi:hypothetical protein